LAEIEVGFAVPPCVSRQAHTRVVQQFVVADSIDAQVRVAVVDVQVTVVSVESREAGTRVATWTAVYWDTFCIE
jgi:hypothetical protein